MTGPTRHVPRAAPRIAAIPAAATAILPAAARGFADHERPQVMPEAPAIAPGSPDVIRRIGAKGAEPGGNTPAVINHCHRDAAAKGGSSPAQIRHRGGSRRWRD